MKKRTAKAIEKKKLDKMWADIIKLRVGHVCEKCGKKDVALNSHHIFARNSHSTRWDLANGICLCTSCHTFGTHAAHRDPSFKDWVLDYIGEEVYDLLRLRYYSVWDKNIAIIRTNLEIELAKF